MRKLLFLTTALLATNYILAQKDSTEKKDNLLDELIITSTRTATQLGNTAVPVTSINQQSIKQAGSLRLKDILQEQAGLNIVNGFGAGLQMQGLNPDYTLILINGEPMIGRTAGVLDMNRISIGNIKKIEIVKGPSSSLYGSEAMAGVINIITDNTFKKNIETSIRYGFGNPDKGWVLPVDDDVYKNLDFNFNITNKRNRTGFRLSSDAYYLDAFSYRPHSTLRSVQPIWRLTNQLQIQHDLSNKTKLSLYIRSGNDYIKQGFSVNNLGATSNSYGKEQNDDININPIITHSFNSHIQSTLKIYNSYFNGSQKLFFTDKPDSVYNDQFKQAFWRVENQTDITLNKARITTGVSYNIDNAQSTRYDDIKNKKRNTILAFFSQHEWTPSKRFSLITGIRYDHNEIFAGAISPKIATRYQLSKRFTLKGSVGRGFKAPDFRQLYLNFTNNAAGGYSVFGTIDAIKIITQMQALGEISEIKDDFQKLASLQPEFSTGLNLGGSFSFQKNALLQFNFFRNDIESLIDYRQVATKTNGAQIFSYINIKNAYTKGAEIEFIYPIFKTINLSAGYQYLITADKDDLNNIKKNSVYTRSSDGASKIMTMKEYVGLPNRSNHMANMKLTYQSNHSFFATARILYKSTWYISDRDGNGLINTNDEFAEGYVMLNMSGGMRINNLLNIQAGIDNVFNYQDVNYLPNLSGRMIYTTINIKIK